MAPGAVVNFAGPLKNVPPQTILTDFIVDWIYPVEGVGNATVVANAYGHTVGLHRKVGDAGSVTYLGFRPRDDQSQSLGYEVRTWFEILSALSAYPPSQPNLEKNDNPSVVSRSTPWLATRFPNGTTAIAVHYRNHVESWPGGFHRDETKDAEVLKQNPLPSNKLDVKELAVNGHKVTYSGRLIVAFRMDGKQRLTAFSGYDCREITIDGQMHRFSDQPLATIAWAPVPTNRQVPGGAKREIWVKGDGPVNIPLAHSVDSAALFLAGGRTGSLANEVPCSIKDGVLRFTANAGWGLAKLYLLPKEKAK